MKKIWKTGPIFLLVFIFLLKSSSIRCQHISIGYADSLFLAEDYEKAALEYEKYVFVFHADSSVNYAIERRALCFKKSGNYLSAYQNFARINTDNTSDSMKCYYNYQMALMLFLSGRYSTSEKFLQKNFNMNVENPDYTNSLLLHALVLNEQYKYREAKSKLLYYAQHHLDGIQGDSLRLVIEQLYDNKAVPKVKSLRKARKISMFIPGGGLFYIGKPGKALTNIALLFGSALYTGINIYAGNYITSATAGIHLIRLFYTGGINQLNDLVPLANNKNTRDFNRKINNSLYGWIRN